MFGIWVARVVGLLEPDAPAGETLGVGLGSGLLVLAAWWAAVASGGRSVFTPVAVGFAVALALALAQWARRPGESVASSAPSAVALDGTVPGIVTRHKSLVLNTLGGGLVVIAVALLYGSTMSASPRDSVQPVEFMDEAFYSILGRDLARTGTETIYLTSGFSDLKGLPAQTWYHWGEMWLASAVITVFGSAPLAARNLIVLPVVLLAAAGLTGTIVRRLADGSSGRAYVFGFIACLVLAPVPLIPGGFFTHWAVGLIFGITLYGLAAVAVLLAIYGLIVLGSRKASWALATFMGSSIAFIVPAHLVVAILAIVGASSVWAIRIVRSLTSTRRLPSVPPVWQRTLAVAGIGIIATVVWGYVTGHAAIGNTGSPTVLPFNAVWRDSVLITSICSGVFVVIPIAWWLDRRQPSMQRDLYFGTLVLLGAGAIAWGLRLSEFTMFYFFYAGIAVFATPVAAVAFWTVLRGLRAARHARLAAALAIFCVLQLELGVATGVRELRIFGPHDYPPISVDLLGAIKQLPSDARLAYACGPFEEIGFAGSRLLAIDTHTGRRVVPMCYEAEYLSGYIGAELSLEVPNTFFKWAPQQALYPNATAKPSSQDVAAFLKENGIHYIYVDEKHPNTLVTDAVPIATSGHGQVLRIP